jgi:uncharacterized protein (TIGR00369 family)
MCPLKPISKEEIQSNQFKNYQHPDNFGSWLGYKLVGIDKEKYGAEVELVVREDHLSSAKKLHGGVIAAFFDYAFGAAVFSSLGPKDFSSTVELKVNYLKPVDLNDVLRARAEVVFRGKRLCVLHGYIYKNKEEDPVAMATATFNIVVAKE